MRFLRRENSANQIATPGMKARFVKNFMRCVGSIAEAIQNYVKAVKDGNFPAPERCF